MISKVAQKRATVEKAPPCKSALKSLFGKYLEAGGDMMKVPEKFQLPLSLIVKETFPTFLVSDGYFYGGLYFSEEAVQEHRNNTKTHKIIDLQDFIVVLNRWSIEMAPVDSTKVFTSYAGVEVRLIAHSFKLKSDTKVDLDRKYPQNIFRDDHIRT